MPETKSIGISFGALSDSISDQLAKQGFKFNKQNVEVFEKQFDAIQHLRFGDLLIDSVYDKIIEKLYKKIVQHVAKENNKKVLN